MTGTVPFYLWALIVFDCPSARHQPPFSRPSRLNKLHHLPPACAHPCETAAVDPCSPGWSRRLGTLPGSVNWETVTGSTGVCCTAPRPLQQPSRAERTDGQQRSVPGTLSSLSRDPRGNGQVSRRRMCITVDLI